MSNTVNFKLEDDLYFKLLALRVRLHQKGGWKGFIERVISDYENSNISPEPAAKTEPQENLIAPLQEKEKKDSAGAGSKSNRDLFNMLPEEDEKTKMLEKCANCGHERSEHNLNGPGCYGDGDSCECKGFVEPIKSAVL
jgi:hypothetical protein